MCRLLPAGVLLLAAAITHAQDFGHWAPTPPMGWNSWDCFGTTVTEQEVKANAEYMARHLKEFGWTYVVVDARWFVANDTWHGYNENNPDFTLDEHGRFVPAVNKFPSSAGGEGFKPLAAYVHSLGLKFGLHMMRGIPRVAVERKTPILGTHHTADEISSTKMLCTWLHDMYTVDTEKPGAQEYYNSIFAQLASWGVDFVKVDDITSPYHADEIAMVRKAIDRCGRPMVLSLSPGPTPLEQAGDVAAHANMWRVKGDFWDTWPQLEDHFELFAHWAPSTFPGHWPDGDMLPLGRIGIRAEQGDPRMTSFTRDEQVTLMSLFAICRSPLMFGGNLPDNDRWTNDLLTNREVLAVLQASSNHHLLSDDGERIIWVADDSAGTGKYVAVFYADRRPVVESKARVSSRLLTYRAGEQHDSVSVNIAGAKKLYLVVTPGADGKDWDHADWIEPTLSGVNGTKRLSQIPWRSATAGWSVTKTGKSIQGNPLVVAGKEYAEGIGTHSTSIIEYDLPEGYSRFSSIVGLDRECIEHTEGATVRFHVFTENPTGFTAGDSVTALVSLEKIGLRGSCDIRDLWAGKELGKSSGEVSLYVKNHGARLLWIRPGK